MVRKEWPAFLEAVEKILDLEPEDLLLNTFVTLGKSLNSFDFSFHIYQVTGLD